MPLGWSCLRSSRGRNLNQFHARSSPARRGTSLHTPRSGSVEGSKGQACFPPPARPLTQAAVPGKELPEGFALLPSISAGSAVAPGRHARAPVVHIVGGDCGACGDPESAVIGPPGWRKPGRAPSAPGPPHCVPTRPA